MIRTIRKAIPPGGGCTYLTYDTIHMMHHVLNDHVPQRYYHTYITLCGIWYDRDAEGGYLVSANPYAAIDGLNEEICGDCLKRYREIQREVLPQ